jgi:hypothetical protein
MAGNDQEDSNAMRDALDEAGLPGVPDTKGEVTKAAEALAAHSLGLEPSQLDETAYPRKARQKST